MKRFLHPSIPFICTGIIVLIQIFKPLWAAENPADFIDGVFKSQMQQHRIAGATLSLYSSKTLAMTKSWGFADVDAKKLTDENTGFGIGSVSKLFVWVSVMQLVEKGLLDINKPINNYLNGSFRLPEKYAPVTIKHLMTHTPGFETESNLFSRQHETLPDNETYLLRNLPAQIYNPGTTPAYSNYGVVLAAYVIEQISGKSFNDYVEENLLGPLGMTGTTFRQPLPEAVSAEKSKGFKSENGRLVSPFSEYIIPAPAGSAVSTASDMLKFMEFLLSISNEKHNSILSPEIKKQMLSRLFSIHPKSDGMGYGFMRLNYNGKEIFWHGGDTYFFHTAFLIIPETETGIFFSVNTAGTQFDYLAQALLIVDNLTGKNEIKSTAIKATNERSVAGSYISTRRVESNFFRLFNSFSNLRIEENTDGILITWPGGKPELFTPVEKDVYISEFKKAIFQRNENGKIEALHFSHLPIIAFQRVPFRENTTINSLLLLLALSVCLRNIVMPVIRLFRKDKRSKQGFRWFLFLSGIAINLFIILFMGVFTDVEAVIFDKPPTLPIILLLPSLSALLFVAAILFWIKDYTWSHQPISTTLWQFGGFLVLVLFYIQAHYMQLFTFMFQG